MRAMRPSRVLRKIRNGETAISIALKSTEPMVSELAALAGFDCIWIDMEHSITSLANVEGHVKSAKVYDVDVLVRVAKGSYSDYIRPLEMDAAGIMVPHLMSAAEAREIVRITKFHPVGRRPLDSGNTDGAYCQVPLADYLEQANRERFVILQIEDPEPLDELDEIAAIPGVDMLFFGPGDFSQGIGEPGNFDHPKIHAAREAVAKVARAHGKLAGTVGTPKTVPDLEALGYQFINIGADVLGIADFFNGLMKEIPR